MDVAETIHYIHAGLLFSGFLIPFFNEEKLLIAYSVVIPFLFFHWSTNNDTCAITLLEQAVRGESDKSKTFVGQLMNGVYILPENDASQFLKGSFFGLWLFVQYRLNRLN